MQPQSTYKLAYETTDVCYRDLPINVGFITTACHALGKNQAIYTRINKALFIKGYVLHLLI